MKTLKRQLPKLTFGFNKDGFEINSKKFHPLNMDLGGVKLESDVDYKPPKAMDLLEAFSSLDVDNATKAQKINALKTILDKVTPNNIL